MYAFVMFALFITCLSVLLCLLFSASLILQFCVRDLGCLFTRIVRDLLTKWLSSESNRPKALLSTEVDFKPPHAWGVSSVDDCGGSRLLH